MGVQTLGMPSAVAAFFILAEASVLMMMGTRIVMPNIRVPTRLIGCANACWGSGGNLYAATTNAIAHMMEIIAVVW